MFGVYQFGAHFNVGTATIGTYRDAGLCIYHRKADVEVTKILSAASPLLVTPVEPVTQPRDITHYLLIELEKSLFLAPESVFTGFLTFPLEIGVYITAKEHVELIDAFTFSAPKYTLYGTPSSGVVCRWWKSSVSKEVPDVSFFTEGVMKVTFQNTVGEWVELRKVVFDAYGMQIFYRETACMHSSVRVLSTSMARTSFSETPFAEGMEKAVKLFTVRKIPIVEKDYVMEWGL